jgi:hypothetical protein
MDKSSKRFDKPRGNFLPQFDPRIDASDKGSASKRFRVPGVFDVPGVFELSQPLAPALISRPSLAMRRLWRHALVLAVSAGLAFLVTDNLRAIRTTKANTAGSEPGAFWWLSLAQARAEPANTGVAKLLSRPSAPRRQGEAVPLGVSIHYSIDANLFLKVSGLVRGTTLSAGFPLGVNGWGLLATDIKDVMIQPPANFIGEMNVTVELFITDTVRIDRQMLRFEWVDAEVPAASITNKTIDKAASDEIAPLLKRGNDLLSSGDFAAARLVLRRAAEAGDARAAFALASTYDPITLEKLHVHGLSPDLDMARRWYETAKELGSQDASRRLEMLASKP